MEMMAELQEVCHIGLFSESSNPTIFQYASLQVKNKLLEAGCLQRWSFSFQHLSPTFCCFLFGRSTYHPVSLQEWKANKGLIASMSPKFIPEADLSDLMEPRKPAMKLCTMSADGNLQIPDAERKRWLSDPVRSDLIGSYFFLETLYFV